ncbi:MAG: cation transporting ATPase C-terminal domain-containing protein [Brachymonas sp.]
MAVIYIPFLQPIFKTQPLSLEEVVLCICLALLVGATVEIEKAGARRRRKR